MNFALRTRNCVSTTRNLVSKTMNFVLKMMNFAAGPSRRQLQGGGYPSVLLAVSFTVKSEKPTLLFQTLNAQLSLPNSVLRTSNVTGGIAPGQEVIAESLRMVCPPLFVETEVWSGTCMFCPAGTEYIEDIPMPDESCTGSADLVEATCTGTADQVPVSCSGFAEVVPATCTGNATEVPMSCVGTTFCISGVFCGTDGVTMCDLDPLTDGTAECPEGCDTTGTCTGTASPYRENCTGTAEVIPRVCTGNAFPDSSFTCDLDPSTDFTDLCPPGCDDAPAYIPVCDLDAATDSLAVGPRMTADGTATCHAGCTYDPGFTAVCDLNPATDADFGDPFTATSNFDGFPFPGMKTSGDCAPGCDDTTSYFSTCDLNRETDGVEFGRPGLWLSTGSAGSDCAPGCAYAGAYVPNCDLNDLTDGTGDCPAGCTERIDFPACDFDASTDGYLSSSAECPAGCTQAPAFTPECDFDDATISSTVDLPEACSIGCDAVIINPNMLPQIEHCVSCPRGKYSEEGATCVYCMEGEQANNYTEGATGCQDCTELGGRYKSHNGAFCTQCIVTQIADGQIASPVQQARSASECMCEAGRYNTTAAAEFAEGAYSCVDVHGETTAVTPVKGFVCESCPRDAGGAMVPCIDCSGANASGVPMPGYWRTTDRTSEIMRCPFGERACEGGVDTQCFEPFGGIACASCATTWSEERDELVDYFLTPDGCEACPESAFVDLLPSVLATMAMLALIGNAWHASAECGAAPVLDQALNSSPPKTETGAVVLRGLISFLQSQAILSWLHADFPAVTSSILGAQAALVDPSSIASWGICWVTPAGVVPSFLPPMAAAYASSLTLLAPACVFTAVALVRWVLRLFKGNPGRQKAATVFKKFQKSGNMARKDFSKLASRTGTSEYDDEAWFDWCTMVGANPEKGMARENFEKLYVMKGPDGEKELEFMFARLFPSPAAHDAAQVDARNNRQLWDQLVSMAVVALYVIHPTCTAAMLSFFSCENLVDGLTVLRSDRGTQCYTPAWFDMGFTVVVPALYLFCHLAPASLVLLMRGRTQEGTLQTEARTGAVLHCFCTVLYCFILCVRVFVLNKGKLTARFGFLFRGYRPAKLMWELVVTGRKLALVRFYT